MTKFDPLTFVDKNFKTNVSDYQKFQKEWLAGRFPGQRFGQAFCNSFGLTDPKLFYMTDKEKAYAYVNKFYVNGE